MVEQRKLIRLGNSSFAIALPKNWIDKSGLKKGDEVFIEHNSGGELIIMPKFKKEIEKLVNIDLKDKEDTSMQIELIGSYLQDYNLFNIKNNIDDKKKKRIKELVKNLMSFEIIEENKDEIKLKDLFNINEANVSGFIRRIDNIIRSFFEDLNPAMRNGKIEKNISNDIQISDKEITKLYLLVGRIFMKSLNNSSLLSSLKISSTELFNYWWAALHIERIGDDLKYIARILEKPIQADMKEINSIYETINRNYVNCMNSFYQKDKAIVRNIIENNKKVISDIEKMNQKEAAIAKIAERLKSLQGNLFQISKMIIYVNP